MSRRRVNPAAWLRLAFLVYAVGVIAYRDAIMDDTYIHLQYARNLRERGELAFNAGEPSLGTTSPLWVLMLAAAGGGERTARLASLACGALSVWVFAWLAGRTLGGPHAVAATVAWAGNVWLHRHAPNGMESAAAVLLVLSAVALRVRAGPHARQAWWEALFGLVLAAAYLARPEAALLGVVTVAADLRSASGRRRARVWVPVCTVLCGSWLLFALLRAGQMSPETAAAKSGMGFGLATWAAVLWREAQVLLVAHPVEIAGLGVALAMALRLEGRSTLPRLVAHPLAPYGAATLLLLFAFAFMDVQVQPRYLMPVLPFLTLAGFAAWRAVLGDGVGRAVMPCLLALIASATASAVRILPTTRAFSLALRPALLPIVSAIAPRGGAPHRVATPDIGFLGYYANVHIVDLGGLIDRRMQEMRRAFGYDSLVATGAFLDLGAVDFVVDRSRDKARFARHVTRGRRWRELTTTVVPNLGLSRPGPYYYTLYALEPDGSESEFGASGPPDSGRSSSFP